MPTKRRIGTQLHARYLTKRINHSLAYSDGEACTNQAESFFSRIRRAEIGIHHQIAGPYLNSYANEMAWREDNRRVSNGELYLMAADAALETSEIDNNGAAIGSGVGKMRTSTENYEHTINGLLQKRAELMQEMAAVHERLARSQTT